MSWQGAFAPDFERIENMADSYALSKTNKVRQLREKASYDRETVHRVLDAGIVAHVGFIQDHAPVVVPMIYGRVGDTILLHGARKSRVIRLLEETSKACLNVTLLDGIVLARSAFNSSMAYRSVTVFGRPQLVDGSAAKLQAMRVISEHSMPGRWDELRDPHDREVKMTGVITLEIETASAKISDNGVEDEDDDYEIPVWAGVLPIQATIGPLEDDDRLLPGAVPSDVVKALQGRTI
jgi:nitroimidazol reductase NimA-like FMN-containing flavoprotein (pyridoxamine 5'-phosphate oxidase superfamily)